MSTDITSRLYTLCFLILSGTLPLVGTPAFSGDFSDDKVVLSDENPTRVIYQDFDYSETILDWQEDVTFKPLRMLEFGQAGIPTAPGLVLSGAFWGNWLYEKTSDGGKFPILSRFPGERGNVSKTSDRWVASNAALAVTARPVNWLTAYAQLEYSEVEFPGQEDWQYRKAFVMIGDLDHSPFYGYFGRNTVDFGWLDGYNPFTHTVNNHSFRVDSDEPVIALGYSKDGLDLVGTLIPSGRHLRVADTQDDDGYSNGAFMGSYTFGNLKENGRQFRIGGGYLHSTIYNNDFPHHPGPTFALSRAASPNLTRNASYDVFAEYIHGPLRFGVERTTTARAWPATGVDVSATNLQAAYDFDLFDRASRVSVVYGLNQQGPAGSEFEDLSQLVVGFETQVTAFIRLSAEYVRNDAFVPLVNIRNVADGSVTAHAFLLGGKINF
ncbi:MAG: hypothetical protein P1U81_16525 [Verrucomicrobiales bacterium]|nr:hypothetical protein [Verrucomicrobiales bacterium]